MIASKANGNARRSVAGGVRGGLSRKGMTSALLVVVTFTVSGTVLELVISTPAAEQAAASGAPAQAKEIVPVKPGLGVSWSEYVAVCPAEMVTEVPFGADGAIKKAGFAVPPKVIVWGEPGASSETE